MLFRSDVAGAIDGDIVAFDGTNWIAADPLPERICYLQFGVSENTDVTDVAFALDTTGSSAIGHTMLGKSRLVAYSVMTNVASASTVDIVHRTHEPGGLSEESILTTVNMAGADFVKPTPNVQLGACDVVYPKFTYDGAVLVSDVTVIMCFEEDFSEPVPPVVSSFTVDLCRDDADTVIDVFSVDIVADYPIDTATVTVVTPATGGTTLVSGGLITYTPTTVTTTDSFTYTVDDINGNTSNVATVCLESVLPFTRVFTMATAANIESFNRTLGSAAFTAEVMTTPPTVPTTATNGLSVNQNQNVAYWGEVNSIYYFDAKTDTIGTLVADMTAHYALLTTIDEMTSGGSVYDNENDILYITGGSSGAGGDASGIFAFEMDATGLVPTIPPIGITWGTEAGGTTVLDMGDLEYAITDPPGTGPVLIASGSDQYNTYRLITANVTAPASYTMVNQTTAVQADTLQLAYGPAIDALGRPSTPNVLYARLPDNTINIVTDPLIPTSIDLVWSGAPIPTGITDLGRKFSCDVVYGDVLGIEDFEGFTGTATALLGASPNGTLWEYTGVNDNAHVTTNIPSGAGGPGAGIDPTGQHGRLRGGTGEMQLIDPLVLVNSGAGPYLTVTNENALKFNFVRVDASDIDYAEMGAFGVGHFVTVKSFTSTATGPDFLPYEVDRWWTGEKVTLTDGGAGIVFTDTAKIRLRTGGTANSTHVYFDDVVIKGHL